MNVQLEALPGARVAYVRQVGPYGPANAAAMEQFETMGTGEPDADGSGNSVGKSTSQHGDYASWTLQV